MLRAMKQIPKNFSSLRSFCTAASPAQQRPFGSTRVVVSGKVLKDAYILDSGAKSILLQTQDPVHGTDIARVHTNTKQDITAGQYVHVTGMLVTKDYINAEDKKRIEATVKATETFVINSAFHDQNLVELRGVVATDTIKTEEFSLFRVVNSFTPKTKTEPIPVFNQVKVYDKNLRELVDNAVEKKAVIRVVGRLETSKDTDKDQKRRSAAYIRATNIFLLAPFSVSQ